MLSTNFSESLSAKSSLSVVGVSLVKMLISYVNTCRVTELV